MSEDLEVEPGVTVGDWLMREFTEQYYIETEPWAVDRAGRVMSRLNPHRHNGQGGRALEVVIPWITAPLAFTAPGRFIFFGRRLYERCPDDETTAFVIGHEMAHHDLGHMDLMPEWMPRFAHAKGGRLAVVAMAAVERRLYGPERECLADEYAIDLCLAAGYDAKRCLAFFQIMENYALDMGDQGMVFGPDQESDAELEPDARGSRRRASGRGSAPTAICLFAIDGHGSSIISRRAAGRSEPRPNQRMQPTSAS